MRRVTVAMTTADVPGLIARYATQLHEHVDGHHVASPFGAWVLLALGAATAIQAADADGSVPDGELRSQVEEALGCDAVAAGRVVHELLANVPESVAASLGAWTAAADVSASLQAAFDLWPAGTATGAIPTQQEADSWAAEATLGLIKHFPLDVQPDTSLLLASALATRITWDFPFEDDEPLPEGSPWAQLGVPLMRSSEGHSVCLWTSPHGLLASHRARGGGLGVLSLLALDSDIPASTLLGYAHHLTAWTAATAVAGHGVEVAPPAGLAEADVDTVFGIPLGENEMLSITEREVNTYAAGEREVRCNAALPAWRADTSLPLSALPGLGEAGHLLGWQLRSWQRQGPGRVDATQAAIAAFDRYGFEAAAITAMAVMAGAGPPLDLGLRREVHIRFARPFVCVAAVDDAPWGRVDGQYRRMPGTWHGLPVFSAAVSEPSEPQPHHTN